MEPMIFAGQAAAFAKSSRKSEDAYYRAERPRARRLPQVDVVVAIAVALLAVGAISGLAA